MYLLGLLIGVTLVNWTYSQSHDDMCAGNDRRINHYVRLNVSGNHHCLFSLVNQTTVVSIKLDQETRIHIICVEFEEARRLCNELGGSKLLQLDSIEMMDAVMKVAPQFGEKINFPIGVQKIKRIPLYDTGKIQQIDFAKVVWDGGYTMDLNSNRYNETTETYGAFWWQRDFEIKDRFIVAESCKGSNGTCGPHIEAINVTGKLFPLNSRMMPICHQHPDHPQGQSPPNQCDVQDNVEKANFTVDNKRHCVFRLFDEDAMTWVQDKNGFFYNKSKADTACHAKGAHLPQITSVKVFRALVNAVNKFKTCSEVDAFVLIPLGIKEIKRQNSKNEPFVINQTVSMVLDNGKTIDTKTLNASAEFDNSRPFAYLLHTWRQISGYASTTFPAVVICHQAEWKQKPGNTTPTGKTGPPVKTGHTGQTGPPKTTGQTEPPKTTGQTGSPGQTGQTGPPAGTGQTGHTPPSQPGQTSAEPPHHVEPTTASGVGGKRGNEWIIIGLIGASMIMVSLGK